jgi:mono/diheme cytochrome c family protein
MKTPFAAGLLLSIAAAAPAVAADGPAVPREFLAASCLGCHDAASKKGGLDLDAMALEPADPASRAAWVRIHDRVRDGEMPPKDAEPPDAGERRAFLEALANELAAADHARDREVGRSIWRRLNRYEYENTVRDLLGAPWLQLRDKLPEDGEAHRYNKSGSALDISHVQMSRYLGAAEYALAEATAKRADRPEPAVRRFYAREQPNLIRKMKFGPFNRSPERATFPLLMYEAQKAVLDEQAPVSVGAADPETREREAFGVVAGSYEPIEPKFDAFRAPMAGRYRLRFSAYSFWAGPGKGAKWWTPDREGTSKGRTVEPVVISSELPPRQRRTLGGFDVTPEPGVDTLEVWLLKGETIGFDAARLFRSRPPAWHNPLATPEGAPGVALRWMEVEGPLFDAWPPAGHRALFGDLPIGVDSDGEPAVLSKDPEADAERLLRAFARRAHRRPVPPEEEVRFLPLIRAELAAGASFAEAMRTGYQAVLCSPEFLGLAESPGRLDDHALAARLAYFLWNSPPDDALRRLADAGALGDPATLRAQVDRMIDDPKSRRFVEAFLDYWLDLRKLGATSPDETLYADYYLDDLLADSALEETRLYFAEMLRADLPARAAVAGDFTFLNDRLASHYGLPPVGGLALRKVTLPPDGPRGGLLTQASVLKVTANGTTTSPVLRGVWVLERILGRPLPPPPPGVPAVEPDIRGTTTIREQLERHRAVPSCAGCHSRCDPPGFALESFDVFGGWRDRYRAIGEGIDRAAGFGKNGQPFAFGAGRPVDPSGTLPDGRPFAEVRALKRLLLADERPLARNLVGQLVTYATGTPVRFGDRAEVERILDANAASGYGTRALVHAIVQSSLFRNK